MNTSMSHPSGFAGRNCLHVPGSLLGRAKRALACLTPALIVLSLSGRAAHAAPTTFGINLPWQNYGSDFGTDPKYNSGPTYNGATMQSYLNDIKSRHMNVVRVWLFEDTSGLSFSGNYCAGVSPQLINNIKDFVTRANTTGLTAYVTFFNNDIPAGYITSDEGDSLLNNAIKPVVQALNGRRVMYDLMNECDYAAPTVGWTHLRNFFWNSTNAIHAINSSTWVTASDDNSTDFNSSFYNTIGGLKFNFYDYHQYSDVNTPLRVTPAAVQNAPLYLGEFGPQGGWNHQSDTANQQLIDHFAYEVSSKGYTGMLAWCYISDSNFALQNKSALSVLSYYGNQWNIK